MYSKHLQFHLSVLNSDDPAVRAAARESLTLHMTKRKANKSSDESSFAGYETSGNKIVKNSKVYWPRSNWVHLFEMRYREDIKLQRTNGDSYEYIHNCIIDDAMSPVHCEHPKAFYTMYKETKLQNMEAEFKSLSAQGRLCREAADDADMRLSSACSYFKATVLCTSTTARAESVRSAGSIQKQCRKSSTAAVK